MNGPIDVNMIQSEITKVSNSHSVVRMTIPEKKGLNVFVALRVKIELHSSRIRIFTMY